MGAEAFKAARDFLFTHRTDYKTVHTEFRWPQLTHFNYALDWFDPELARGSSANQPALKIVGEDAATVTFAELCERSNRIANGLHALGVKRGERILLMLGNVVPLWETMLAAIKLGAVVIPASTLLTRNDLQDRFERGHVRHLIANAADAAKFDGLDATVKRIALGEAPSGWTSYASLLNGSPSFTPDAPTNATDPMLLYFTSGTTALPKLVEHPSCRTATRRRKASQRRPTQFQRISRRRLPRTMRTLKLANLLKSPTCSCMSIPLPASNANHSIM
jgi:acetyl-CoA synthetase